MSHSRHQIGGNHASRAASSARWRVGVDGGATQTRVAIADAGGTVRVTAAGPASTLALGSDVSWARIQDVASQAFAALGETLDWSACAIGIGIAGAHNTDWHRQFVAAAPPCASLTVDTDAFASLLGAHGGDPGAIVAVGTGSVGEVMYPDGSRRGIGGYGFPAGDEASGAWIGQQLSVHLQHALDGRIGYDALAEAVADALGGGERQKVLDVLSTASAPQFASLVPVVLSHRDHPHVQRTLARAGCDVASMLDAVAANSSLPVALCGGLADTLRGFLPLHWQTRLTQPQADAAHGALLLIDVATGMDQSRSV